MRLKVHLTFTKDDDNKALLSDSTNRSDYMNPKVGRRNQLVRNRFGHTKYKFFKNEIDAASIGEESSSWKTAVDKVTKKRYFYNKYTRQTTWTKPSSFIEWKVFVDQSTANCYYYNVLTKETTWSKPKEFEELNSINLPPLKYNNANHPQTNSKAETQHDTDKSLPTYLLKWNNKHDSSWKAFFHTLSGNHFFYNFATKESTWTKPKEFQEWVAVDATSTDGTYFYNVLTGVSSWNKPHSILSQDDKENQESLVGLVSTCRPAEEINNRRLMPNCEGRERLAIQSIEPVLESDDAPFDEHVSSVSTYVKSAVTFMSPVPYDERSSHWRSSIRPSKSTSNPTENTEQKKQINMSTSSSPTTNKTRQQTSGSSAHSRYLTKSIQLAGSNGRTVLYLPR